MPIYMDRHEVPGLTARIMAEAHREDLKVQNKYNCLAFTYWFDAERESGFCLIEAPNKQAVIRMHEEAHGGIPTQIIEVDMSIVKAFLGRVEDPQENLDIDIPDLFEPAFRIIMAAELKDACLLKAKYGKIRSSEILKASNDLIDKAIMRHEGREVECAGNIIMGSFMSAKRSLECALDIQKHFREQHDQRSLFQMDLAIGLSAGNPVTGSDEFFGDTIPFARRLSHICGRGQVLISSEVKDQLGLERVESPLEKEIIKNLIPPEEKFLNRLLDIMEIAWNMEEFNVNDLGRRMASSKAQLYRKIKALTGRSPTKFIREYRLKKAIELMQKRIGNVSEIAFETGFGSPSYFSKCFQKRFGILPAIYLKTA